MTTSYRVLSFIVSLYLWEMGSSTSPYRGMRPKRRQPYPQHLLLWLTLLANTRTWAKIQGESPTSTPHPGQRDSPCLSGRPPRLSRLPGMVESARLFFPPNPRKIGEKVHLL